MDFPTLTAALFADLFRLQPVAATELGDHEHDGEWPDLSVAGRAAWLAWVKGTKAQVEALDPASLSRDEVIDRRILLENLAAMRFFAADLREDEWNPLSSVYLLGGGLFALISREFAPLPARLRSVVERLDGIPSVLEAARVTLTTPGARPVSRFHAEKAVERMAGIPDLVAAAVIEGEQLGDAALLAELRASAEGANAAITSFTAWLRDELLPTAHGDFRLGPELYAAKFHHSLMSDYTPDTLRAIALAEYDRVRAEMISLARRIWPDWMGAAPAPADDDEAVRAVLGAIGADHPAAEALLDFCREENARIEAFVAEKDLVGLADEPMQIVWTPQFLRSFGGAMLIPPGPLDRGLDSFFAITPLPEEWSEERKESKLREDNARQLRLLTIHEAVPGHYLQLAYSNRTSSPVRAAFQSGVFAEGWAVYVTQLMMDIGYGADDPALMLIHWKFYLRSVTNALMDMEIHAGTMDQDAAMQLMVGGGFQEEAEAVAKWDRARLSSTQLCSYFLGSVEMHGLETEARRRAAAEGRPFVYRPFLESVLAHGTPSLPVIREILFGA